MKNEYPTLKSLGVFIDKMNASMTGTENYADVVWAEIAERELSTLKLVIENYKAQLLQHDELLRKTLGLVSQRAFEFEEPYYIRLEQEIKEARADLKEK